MNLSSLKFKLDFDLWSFSLNFERGSVVLFFFIFADNFSTFSLKKTLNFSDSSKGSSINVSSVYIFKVYSAVLSGFRMSFMLFQISFVLLQVEMFWAFFSLTDFLINLLQWFLCVLYSERVQDPILHFLLSFDTIDVTCSAFTFQLIFPWINCIFLISVFWSSKGQQNLSIYWFLMSTYFPCHQHLSISQIIPIQLELNYSENIVGCFSIFYTLWR